MKRQDPFSIVYEDERILAVDKVSGLSVVADRYDESRDRLDELLNRYFAQELQNNPDQKPRIPFPHRVLLLHRIDKDTSGLVLFAKDTDTQRMLSRLFQDRAIRKSYIALVHGRPAWEETECNLPLKADGDRAHRTVIDKWKGKTAVTRFKYLGGVANYSVLLCMPESGRTHQIRVHLSSMGYPIICDPLYGSSAPLKLSSFKRGWRGNPDEELPLLSRLGLHAYSIEIPDYNAEGEPLLLTVEAHKDINACIRQIEKASGSVIKLS